MHKHNARSLRDKYERLVHHVQSHSWAIAGITQRKWDISHNWSAVVDRHKPFRRHTQGKDEESSQMCGTDRGWGRVCGPGSEERPVKLTV